MTKKVLKNPTFLPYPKFFEHVTPSTYFFSGLSSVVRTVAKILIIPEEVMNRNIAVEYLAQKETKGE